MITAAIRTAVLSVLAIVFLVAVSPAGPALSSAAFTTHTSNPANSVGSAIDWTPPAVSVQQPAAPLRDVATITATASDAETGIRQVVISVQAVGATTWTTLCTPTAAPYTCSWDTRTVADGSYDLRAVATDNAGYSTTSATVRVTVGNAVTLTLAEPGDLVRGTVNLVSTIQNAGAGPYSVRFEYAVASSNNWKTLCTTSTTPYTCSWSTSTFANDFYDLRSVVTAGGVTTYSNVVTEVLVDNASPTVTMVDPGSPLRGTVTLAATATDDHSGIARVVIQYAPNGSSTWQDACTITAAPYSCRFSTTTLANAAFSFRAVATDAAGNVSMSTAVTNRSVDNTVASVAMEDPGAYLTGTVTLTASASTTAGVASVAIQVAPNGTSTWTTVCTLTTSPYSCAWNSKSVTDGLYSFRAILADRAGGTLTSAVVASRSIDNRAVRGVDVQAANGAAKAGRLETNDTMTFTYSTQMNPASIASGWNGAPTSVTLRLRDGGQLALTGTDDTVDILRSGAAVSLGSVNLKGDYIRTAKTATFNATMTASSATVNGQTVTVVQIQVGAAVSAGGLRTAAASVNAIWTPSAQATDLAGTASSITPVTESGAADKEF